MGMINQSSVPQAGTGMSERLQKAYKRISPNLRKDARLRFCEAHHITDYTFRCKRVGIYEATEGEVQWMEAYDPYQKALTA
jgi:hypothetical protein